MTQINWGVLGQPQDAGVVFQQAFERGRGRSAMAALSRDPANQDALAALYQVDSAAAARMETVGRERASWNQSQEALAAQRNYITARYGGGGAAPMQDALGGRPGRNPHGPTYVERPKVTLDALGSALQPGGVAPPAAGGVLSGFGGGSPAAQGVLNALPGAPASPGGAGVLGGFGGAGQANSGAPAAQPPADQAWLAYAQADPAGAMKARQEEAEWTSARMKLTEADLKAHQAVVEQSLRLLNGVTDQASYDRALAEGHALHDRYGYDMPEFPAAYDPHVVDAYRRQALDVKDAVAADLADRKFGWQQQDDQIDNARADRSENRQERYRARSDSHAERADRRSAVRFSERALDRAAMAGVRNDTSDLDY